jgi:beta-lactamase class A
MLFLLLAVFSLILASRFIINDRVKAHPLEDSANIALATPPISLTALNNLIGDIIQDNSGITFGISMINLSDNSQLNYGETEPMEAASVSKILTATDFLNQVELGNESLGETLEDGNSASYDLQQMITVSDDNAWASLNDELGYDQLQDYANQLELDSYDASANNLSASDTATLLSQLYHGKLLDPTDTQLMLSYMKVANYRSFIVPAVPSHDTVYHKVGEVYDNVNDAAIITNGKQSIVLVIYTNGNGTYNWTERATLMQQITRAALRYYHLD